MLFNFGKCKCLHTGPGTTGMNYEMGGTILGKTAKVKDLGVSMNANMKVSEQCRIAASKVNQVLGMIRRNVTYEDKSLIIPLYKAIVRPHLEYCIQAWSPYLRKDIDMVENSQRRATKLIPGFIDLTYEERLKECGLMMMMMMMMRGATPLRPLGAFLWRGEGSAIACPSSAVGGSRRLPLVGGACPSGYCQVDMAVHLVGPVPTPHGALGGRQATEGSGPASGASASAQLSAGRKKVWWLPPDTTSR